MHRIVHNAAWFKMGDMNMWQAMVGKGREPEMGTPPVPEATPAVLTAIAAVLIRNI